MLAIIQQTANQEMEPVVLSDKRRESQDTHTLVNSYAKVFI